MTVYCPHALVKVAFWSNNDIGLTLSAHIIQLYKIVYSTFDGEFLFLFTHVTIQKVNEYEKVK